MNCNAIKYIFLLLFSFVGLSSSAQSNEDNEEQASAAANAANPLAFVTKLQFQPNYTFKDGGGDQFSLITRIIQPTKTIGLPFFKSKNPDKIYTIYRLEAPIISQTFPEKESSNNATGISDLVVLDVITFKKSWGLTGIGPALTIPTASPELLGFGKWNAGLVAVLLSTKIPKLQLGALVQQFVSVAGSSSKNNSNFMLLQPIVNKILTKGLYIQFSPTMKFDWENDQYSIPLSLSIGKAFAKNLSLNFGPEYVVSGPNEGDFTIRVNVNSMFAPPR